MRLYGLFKAALERDSKAVASESRSTPVRTGPVARRNQVCPCGSGVQFKKCCGGRVSRPA